MFGPSKDKIDEVYKSFEGIFKIEDCGDLNKYLEINLDHWPDFSIHIRQPYLNRRILNTIPGMYRSKAKPTPVLKPPLEKVRDLKQEK